MVKFIRGGCMARLREGLYSVHIESCIITLTLVSVLAITGELLINLHIVQVPQNTGDGSNGDGINGGVTHNTSRIDVSDPNTSTVGNPIDPGGGVSVDPLQTAHLVFHYISLVIAAVFLVEMMLKILAKGKSFFLKIFQVADALIVLGTFALEVVFTVEQEELPVLEAATFIVILRLWRVPSTCNIRAKECRREMLRELEVWQNAKHKLEERCKDMQSKMDKQQDRIRDMEKQLEKNASLEVIESGRGKEQKHHDLVGNGYVSHGMFTQINEENANHLMTADNERGVEENNPTVDSVKGEVLHESLSSTDTNHERLNVNGDAMDTNSAQAGLSQARGPFSRTDSESSLSCDHVEQEVVVQIEGPPSPKQHVSTTDDTAGLLDVSPGKVSEEFSYSNAMFEDEIGHQDLPVLHEIDGVKTYRSADGIPMTSL
ncbi:uncharacterized protein LOC124268218 isoform X3 [Haliotis rubra]|uniref:uncharacterized protein LOC124268218 isoform X3 n=1 Tax=Haliotis rubra TaxID=36100 RepID=UPI001EE4FCEA|nr:uncharacterized protein LOC124268218 isoform X3 [Haliotis rubra]